VVLFPAAAFALDAPTNFAVKERTSTSITWQWTDVAGEDGYEVQDSGDVLKVERAAVAGSGTTIWIEDTTCSTPNTQYTRHCRSFTSSSQEKTVGTGTVSEDFPMDYTCDYARCQMLYLQTEINTAGTITKIYFYRNNTDTAITIDSCTIYMDHSTATELTAWVGGDSGPGTLVYSGSIACGSTPHWVEITLDTSFTYNLRLA
jgi:hypothetical protein